MSEPELTRDQLVKLRDELPGSYQAWAHHAVRGTGPAYRRDASGKVRYPLAGVLEWIAERAARE